MADTGHDDKYPPTPNADGADGCDADPDAGSDGRGGTVPRSGSATVYVDLSTELYHSKEAHAGPDPAAFTRDQAERFSYRACTDCFDSRGGRL